MILAISQVWMFALSMYVVCALLTAAGLIVYWFERSRARHDQHLPRPPAASANAGPHHPV